MKGRLLLSLDVLADRLAVCPAAVLPLGTVVEGFGLSEFAEVEAS